LAEIILSIGLLVFMAHFFVAMFKRTGVPDVLLLTLIGLVLGPVLHLVQPRDFGQVGAALSTMALVIILFESGLTLDPHVLARTWRPILSITILTFVFTVTVTALLGHFLLGIPPLMAAIMGTALGGVSAAVAIPMVKNMAMREPGGTILIMESAFGDVLSIVLLLALVDAASRGGGVHVGPVIGGIFASLVCALLLGVLGGVLWLYLLNIVRRLPNSVFTTLAFLMVIYGVTDVLGFSGAIAALAFGFTLDNHHYLGLDRIRFLHGRPIGKVGESDVEFYMELLFLLKTFFFIYLGASIRLGDLRITLVALTIVGAVYLGRPFLTRFSLRGVNVGGWEAGIVSFMVPKGLVSAVLASIPLERGLEGAELLRNVCYMVILFSIVLTAVLVVVNRTPPARVFFNRLYGAGDPYAPVATGGAHSATPVAP
jgi:NhaP-type Na+/H+ or K+/H+ antiporter